MAKVELSPNARALGALKMTYKGERLRFLTSPPAPFPHLLEAEVERRWPELEDYLREFRYKTWQFRTRPGTLIAFGEISDSSSSGVIPVCHQMGFPPGWRSVPVERWLFEVIVKIEVHEAAEFFTHAGTRPFHPHRKDTAQPLLLIHWPT